MTSAQGTTHCGVSGVTLTPGDPAPLVTDTVGRMTKKGAESARSAPVRTCPGANVNDLASPTWFCLLNISSTRTVI
ncbi:MAG: hypothetical protein L0K17_01605 [Corynebacterium sp.]|nr:hypothetical protein [Corynebacterium sp.]